MVVIADEAVEVAERFINMIKDANIKVERAILFGSCAKRTAGKWSDIDIAIVSSDFSGMPFHDRKMLTPFLLKVDTRLELHPFRPEDFTEDNDFVREIMKNGLELNI